MNAREAYLRQREAHVRERYDALATDYAKWLRKYRYYYTRKLAVLKHLEPLPGCVLEIGCGVGQNLAGLNPTYGLGIDISPKIVEKAREIYPVSQYPNIEFRCMSALDVGSLNRSFETIILANSITEVPEVMQTFRAIRDLCTPRTRVIQISYNYLLAPVVKASARIGLSPDRPVQNWLTRQDFQNFAYLSDFEIVREGFDMLVPFGIPLLSEFVNRFGPLLPGLKYFAMLYYTVFRPLMPRGDTRNVSVSVCVPCKNEEGNVDQIVARVPQMGKHTEIIFVDDKSTDATAAKVDAQIRFRPDKTIKLTTGPGVGKGGACRAGFEAAEGDVLMILDADMTVMPEDLPVFLETLVSGKGEFVNGSRLVYPMEGGAMKFANLVGNKMFALLFSFLLSQRLKDTLCGTKVIWRRDYSKILEARRHFGEVDRWGDYDWIFGAARHNLRIVELPVHYRVRTAGETKMIKRLQNAWIMLKMCNIAFRKLKLIRTGHGELSGRA